MYELVHGKRVTEDLRVHLAIEEKLRNTELSELLQDLSVACIGICIEYCLAFFDRSLSIHTLYELLYTFVHLKYAFNFLGVLRLEILRCLLAVSHFHLVDDFFKFLNC